VLAGAAGERAVGGQDAFSALDRRLVEGRNRKIPASAIGADPLTVEGANALNLGAHQRLLN
jgi:hypothetical protein